MPKRKMRFTLDVEYQIDESAGWNKDLLNIKKDILSRLAPQADEGGIFPIFINLVSSKKIYVESSNIDWVGYDSHKQELEVAFKGKRTGYYQYKDVPESLFTNLLEAESVGKFFNSTIKGKYATTRIDQSA